MKEDKNFKVEDIFYKYDIYRKASSWVRYHDMYNRGITFILDQLDELSLGQKIKVIEYLAEKIDNDVEEKGLRKGKALTFKERTRRLAIRLRGGHKNEREYFRDIKRHGHKDKLIAKIKSENYVLSPPSYNYLLFKTKYGEGKIVLPNYSLKAEALIDLLFDYLAGQLGYGFNASKALSKISIFDIEKAYRNEKKYGSYLFFIDFETSEMRKRLNVPYSWTDEEFVKAALELRDKSITLESVKIYPGEDGKYKDTITLYTSICCAIGVIETDKIAPRTRNVQHRIRFFVDLVTGLLFRNDILRQKYSMFPTKKEGRTFYRMKSGSQRLYRYLSLWQSTHLTFEMATDILGYSEKGNVTRIKNLIEGYLDELVDAQLIKGWWRNPDKKGKEIIWLVGVTKDIPELMFAEGKKRDKLSM